MADWKNIGQARWYDCKLGTMRDQDLAALVGTAVHRIRYRRELFGIDAWNAKMAIEPHKHLLGNHSIRAIARLCGVSASSVDQFRKSLGIKPWPGPEKVHLPEGLPPKHPLRPYTPLIGVVHDKEVADLAGVSQETVQEWREILGRTCAEPLPEQPKLPCCEDFVGPLLGYESLFGQMSVAKISRAVGIPYPVIEQRRQFLGAEPHQRVSKLARYQHLVGVIPITLLARLAGVSVTRAREFQNKLTVGTK